MRSGWKKWVAGSCAALVVALISGCGDSNDGPKAPSDTNLKPVNSGGTTEQVIGKKGQKGSAGSTAGVQ